MLSVLVFCFILPWVSTLFVNRFSIKHWVIQSLSSMRFLSLVRRYSLIKDILVKSKKNKEANYLNCFLPTSRCISPIQRASVT